MNVTYYIKKHKDKDFKEFKFTEVDNLVLALLAYLDFRDVVPAFKGSAITLKEAFNTLKKSAKYRGLFFKNTYDMLEVMSTTKRYGDALLYNYMNVKTEEMQFGALTIKLNDNSIYVAFSGTDTSIVGWEEDFKMAYLYPGASQKYASVYLNKAIKIFDKNIRVGGHSKGGNLAISAVMNAKFYIRNKIIQVYNNDGPGFLKEQVENRAYKKIEDKIKMYVPKDSIVGMFFYHIEDYTVVRAKSRHILQHDAFNWLCHDTGFITDKLSKRSRNLENRLTKKLEELPLDTRIKTIKQIFDIFRNNNIIDIKDINIKDIINIIKGIHTLDKDTQNILVELLLTVFIK